MNDKKKIKVGTLTFHKSLNYGSFLQAYALQQKLMMMGCDTELIDFEPSGFKKMYSDLLPPVNMWNITYDYIHLRLWKCVKSRRIGFENAARKLLKLSTEKYDAFTGLKGAEEKYDAVICGSDQIWNSYANDFDLNYMLAGLKGVSKIAYAVSINKGRYEESKDEPAIRKALMDFDRLSVREQNGSKYLEKYLDNKKVLR